MPTSNRGVNTNSETIPDPSDISQTIANTNFWFVSDANVAPPAVRTISVASGWVSDRTLASGQTLSIANVAQTAFDASPSGVTVAVGVSPDSLPGATFDLNETTSAFTFTSSTPGVYRLVFTGLLVEEPGRRAEAVLTITVP